MAWKEKKDRRKKRRKMKERKEIKRKQDNEDSRDKRYIRGQSKKKKKTELNCSFVNLLMLVIVLFKHAQTMTESGIFDMPNACCFRYNQF